MYFYFGRIYHTLTVTPAMEAGISDHIEALRHFLAPL
jgi:hypothetical protein